MLHPPPRKPQTLLKFAPPVPNSNPREELAPTN
jgi:hypothetical protein